MPDLWTIQRILAWTSDFFARKEIDAPRLTAELLLAHVLGCDRVRLYMDFDRPLDKRELASYRGLIERRAAREPTHYLLGKREFFGRSFAVDPRVLIPRPETEVVVERALSLLSPEASGSLLDLCTGTGCIALTLAAERPSARVVATDASEAALAVARHNAEGLRLSDRVELLLGDLWAPVEGRSFSLIVSNPPYVSSGVIASLMPEVLREPRSALDGGADGLSLVRRIVREAPRFLEPGGGLVLEIGDDQGPAVRDLLAGAGFLEPRIEPDLAGRDRIAWARRP